MENTEAGLAETDGSLRPRLIQDSYISFVNMDHRKDRLVLMEDLLCRRDIPAVRTRGMHPSEYKGDPASVRVMRERTPGAIGCHFSQVAVMTEALRQGKHAWVMEDDLKICPDIFKRLNHMEEFCLYHPWDILWMGGTFHVHPPHWHKATLGRDAECTDDPRMLRTYGAFCTYSYIVNRDSVAKVLQGLDHWLPKSMGIDWAMIQLQPSLHTYAYVPGCCIQRDGQSDIGYVKHKTEGKKPGFTKFSGFSKLGPYWFANHLEEFDPTKFNWWEASRR